MTQNSILSRCDSRCGRNWHVFCSASDCQYYDEMIIHSDAGIKAGFVSIGNKPKRGGNIDD